MTQRMFCIRCGKDAIQGTVFCEECTAGGEPLASAPDMLEFEICPSCGKAKRGSTWSGIDDLADYMRSGIRRSVSIQQDASVESFEIEGLRPDESSSNVTISLTLLTHGVKKGETLQQRVRIIGNTCPTCNRRSGHYFESTIQLRTRGDERAEAVQRALSFARKICSEYEKTEQGFFVSEIRETRGGVDISLSSNTVGAAIAKKIAQKFGAEVVPTRKLYGRRNGKEIYRTTFLVRVAGFNPGDYVQYGEGYYRVARATDTILIEPLAGGKGISLRPAQSGELRLIGGRELEEWADVVGNESGSTLIRDPKTLEEVAVGSAAVHLSGSRIRVVRLEGTYFEVGG